MKILIRATNWVGDAILALPALRAVRKRYSDADIAIVARPYVADIYRDQEICNQLIAYDPKSAHAGFSGRERLAVELRAQKFDVALLLQNAFDAAWLAWRAKIPERIGYARDGRSFLLTKAVPLPRSGEIPAHEQFYYLELLRRAGWMDTVADESFISLRVPEEKRRSAGEFLRKSGVRQGAMRIAIGAGASPAEASVSTAISAEMRRPPIDLTGKTAIADLPALLSQCHLFIGNDSGAMHVAGAVGLPVVAVFGPTDPFGTAPVTPRCTIVQQKPYCSPCFLRRCPTDHRCMTAVTADMVEAAAAPWLSSIQVQRA